MQEEPRLRLSAENGIFVEEKDVLQESLSHKSAIMSIAKRLGALLYFDLLLVFDLLFRCMTESSGIKTAAVVFYDVVMVFLLVMIWQGSWPSVKKMPPGEQLIWKTVMTVLLAYLFLSIVLWHIILRDTSWVSDSMRSIVDAWSLGIEIALIVGLMVLEVYFLKTHRW